MGLLTFTGGIEVTPEEIVVYPTLKTPNPKEVVVDDDLCYYSNQSIYATLSVFEWLDTFVLLCVSYSTHI